MARTLSGNLDTFSLADLLQWLEINALSGRVTVWRGEVVRTIDLKGGAIVFVSSSLPNERLGVFLTRRKVLTEPVVFELLAESFATGRNLTRLILERNLLPREKLAEAVEGLAMKVLLDLFHWAGATFEFDPLFKIEDLIRIHLSLRGQVLAFHGAKSVDDSRVNVGTATGSDETGARWEREFKPEVLAAMFWEILEGLPGRDALPGLPEGIVPGLHVVRAPRAQAPPRAGAPLPRVRRHGRHAAAARSTRAETPSGSSRSPRSTRS